MSKTEFHKNFWIEALIVKTLNNINQVDTKDIYRIRSKKS